MRGKPNGVARGRQLEVTTFGGRVLIGAFVREDDEGNLQVKNGDGWIESVDLHDVEVIRQGPNAE